MPSQRPHGADRRQGRTWSFASCTFDEDVWALSVGGRRVAVESKPLELLHELLLNPGKVVTKDELLDRIWPEVIVVEASLPTAVRKLRLALNDDNRDEQIIETVPRIGYRLAVPVDLEKGAGPSPASHRAIEVSGDCPETKPPVRAGGSRRLGWLAATGVIAAAAGLAPFFVNSAPGVPVTVVAPAIAQRDAMNAIRRLDVDAIERMLAAGWDPNLEIEAEGNAALHTAVEICEWDPGHDRGRLVLMARTLYEGGGRYDQRNVWGDTPYSIAKAERYCGKDHPVTKSIRATCFQGGGTPLRDRCLASYEIARGARE